MLQAAADAISKSLVTAKDPSLVLALSAKVTERIEQKNSAYDQLVSFAFGNAPCC